MNESRHLPKQIISITQVFPTMHLILLATGILSLFSSINALPFDTSERSVSPSASDLIPTNPDVSNERSHISKPEETLQAILNAAKDPNEALVIAVDHEEIEVIKMLLRDPQVDPTYEKNTAFNLACRSGNMDIVKLFISDRRVDISGYDNAALLYATLNGHKDVVVALLSSVKFRHTQGVNLAIEIARQHGYPEIQELLSSLVL